MILIYKGSFIIGQCILFLKEILSLVYKNFLYLNKTDIGELKKEINLIEDSEDYSFHNKYEESFTTSLIYERAIDKVE